MSIYENLKPTADEISAGARHLAQLRAVFMPPALPASRRKVEFTVEDIDRLPSEFVIITPNEAALRALADRWSEGQPLPTAPGVNFKISST